MVGQKVLRHFIQGQIDAETFPKFAIFVGEKGSGKKTFVQDVFTSRFWQNIYHTGTGVDDVRNIIAEANRLRGTRTVFYMPDADSMSLQAQNALLKVAEEPPKDTYIILTVEDEHSLLDTIRSRGNIYRMESYTRKDIEAYAKERYRAIEPYTQIAGELCQTPGDVNELMEYGPQAFYKFVELVVEHVAVVSLANALKIANKVALKDEVDKYSLKMFLRAFLAICGARMLDDSKYLEWSLITSATIQKVQTVRGVNKQMLFDSWLFDIREWDDGR